MGGGGGGGTVYAMSFVSLFASAYAQKCVYMLGYVSHYAIASLLTWLMLVPK